MAVKKSTASKGINWLDVAIYSAAAIAVLIISLRVARNIKARKQEKKNDVKDVRSSSGGGAGLNLDLVLKRGVNGNEVRELQRRILRDGGKLPRFGDDGKFGQETEDALFYVKKVRQITLKGYDNTPTLLG